MASETNNTSHQNVSEKDLLWDIYNDIVDTLQEPATKEDYKSLLREIRDKISEIMY